MQSTNMIHFIIRILGNSLALYVASLFVQGFSIHGGIKEYLLAGVILGLLNLVVRPVLKLISMPIIIITLGIFSLVINALMLWLVHYAFDFVVIADLYALAWATIIITIVNTGISSVAKITD